MKIQIQYGGHQVMKTNNTYFLKNFEKKQSNINNKNICKKPEQSKQSKFEKQN
jgi:hypothetical protein